MNKGVKLRLVLGSVVLSACFLGLIPSVRVLAEGDEISCSFSYSVDDEHTVNIMNGQYRANIGTTTFGASCSDTGGFSIYAVGNSANQYGNNNLVATVGGELNPEDNIETGTSVSGDNSSWAMRLSALAGDYAPTIEGGFDDYSAIPSGYVKVASFDGSTDELTLSLQSTYAVFVSRNQPAGLYTGGIKYTLVHPQTEEPLHPEACPGDGNICYIPNAKNVVGRVAAQGAYIGENTLRTSNFKRAGYGFAGWNTEYDYSGITYGPNETITISDYLDEGGLPLYAVWVKSSGSLQNWNGCYELSVGDVIALTDQRDNQTYAISKLADGKCWMIENLRLSDNADNKAMSQGYGGKFAGLPESQYSEEFRDDVTPYNSLYYYDIDEPDDYHGEATINIGSDDYPSTRLPRYNNNNTAWQADVAEEPTNYYYGYGHYYNWPAAIANTSFFGNNNTRTTTSICPTGWRLPMGGDKNGESVNEYWNLIVKSLNNNTLPSNYGAQETPNYSGSTETKTASELIRAYPNNFIKSGKYEGGDHVDPGDGGMYWSSISGPNEVAYGLYFDETSLYPGTKTEMKYNGGTIRCITTPEEYQDVTVHFDSGVSSIVFHSDEFGEQEATANGATVSIAKNAQYTIWATYSADNRGANTWTTTSSGVLGSTTSAVTTYTVSDDAELSLTSKEVCPADKICYQRNDTATGTLSGAMGQQSIGGTEAVLMASNYSNTEYGFAGWNTAPDGSGISYGPNETIHYESGAYSRPYNGLTLYAMWVPSDGYLQNWFCPNDSIMPIGTVTALTDFRDNQVYAVAKLADGDCWIIENMRLESEYTVGNNTNNPNVTNQSLAQGYASSSEYGNFIGLANAEQSSFDTNGDSNSIYGTDIGVIVDIGHIDASAYRMPRYNNTNITARASEPVDNTENIYSYGNYYTWHAAVADTAYYGVDNKNSNETSICPVGWELPTGGSAYAAGSTKKVNVTGDESTYRDYYNLGYHLTGTTAYENNPSNGYSYYSASTGEIFRKYPNNFLYSGVYYGSSAQDRGTSAYYWAATSGRGDGDAYQLSISQDVWPGTNVGLTYKANPIRCVSKKVDAPTIDGFVYMQDFANLSAQEMEELKEGMVENEQYLIRDSRDNKDYFVSKLADGNIWMTQNLDFDIGSATLTHNSTTLYHDDTDLGYGTSVTQSWTPDEATYTYGDSAWDGSAVDRNAPQSYDPGKKIWNGTVDNTYDTNYNNMSQGSDLHYSLGNYYSWGAAIATNDNSAYTVENEDVDQSICPAGWMLPKIGFTSDSNSFKNLVDQLNLESGVSGNLHQFPVYFVYSGNWLGESTYIGANGSYWSSTVYGEKDAYSLYFSSGSKLDAYSYDHRSAGNFVRCIARTPKWSIDELGHMQDFATLSSDAKADVLNSMAEGEQYQLTDSRDDKVYYISKLADGNVWMTQNLDFDIVNGGADINSINTDVPANWTGAGHLNNTYATEYDSWDHLGRYPESYDAGDLCWDGSIGFNDDAEWYQYTVPCTDRHYHVGNYYNWTAAVALEDAGMYFDPEESAGNDDVDVNQSICPAGWMLPKDGISSGSGSYEYLVNQQHLTGGISGNIYQAPAYFVYGGWYYGGIPDYFGGEGFYLTSAYLFGNYGTMGNMAFDEYDSNPIRFNVERSNDDGYSLRCLVRK